MDQAKQSHDSSQPRRTFPRAHRLRTAAEYAGVYDARVRESRGPLTVYARPSGLPHLRLGFSVSRKVAIAVKRNRIRRLLREAYRLMRGELPVGYDLVLVVRPHVPLTLHDYRRLLRQCIIALDQKWLARATTGPAGAAVPQYNTPPIS